MRNCARLELFRHKVFSSAVGWPALGDAMSRFYLHIRCKDGGMSYDDLGLDYPDVETAWRAVARAAQDLKQVFATRGHDPRDYAIEVEDDTGEIVFRLPFSEQLRPSLSQSHATYKLVGSHLGWLIYRDDEFVGGFAQRASAESLVWEMVETRCAEHKASQVLVEDELVCEKHLCHCFKEAPPGTLLS
jgi:peptide methionine sulfoxide reductase MsrB